MVKFKFGDRVKVCRISDRLSDGGKDEDYIGQCGIVIERGFGEGPTSASLIAFPGDIDNDYFWPEELEEQTEEK